MTIFVAVTSCDNKFAGVGLVRGCQPYAVSRWYRVRMYVLQLAQQPTSCIARERGRVYEICTQHQFLDPGRAPTTIIQCVITRFFFKTNTLLPSFSVQSFSSFLSEKRVVVVVSGNRTDPIEQIRHGLGRTPSSYKPAWAG
jgi:hypothetical protein